ALEFVFKQLLTTYGPSVVRTDSFAHSSIRPFGYDRHSMKKNRLRLFAVAAFAVVGLTAAVVATPSLADSLDAGDAKAAKPRPVFSEQFADPAVTWTGKEYVAVSTGRLAPLLTSPTARGPWKYQHGGLKRLPKWANKKGGIWA